MDRRAWIEAQPDALAGQRRIMLALADWCEADERVRWLAVGCSVGRGAGDGLSDLDLGMGIQAEDFDAAVADVQRAVDGLSELVDSYHHKLPELASTHERIFAQYANRCQVDLVVLPDEHPVKGPRDFVLLYDADDHEVITSQQLEVTPDQVRSWAFNGWACLADVGKYLRRGSAWEALERLHQARAELWRLLAVAAEIPNPLYGVTSLLDFAPDRVPPEVAATTSNLGLASLLSAARSLASQLTKAGRQLTPAHQAALPTAMATYITADLAALHL